MDQEDDLLESLLAVATEELEKIENNELLNVNQTIKETTFKCDNKVSKAKILKETDLFELETNIKSNLKPLNDTHSVVHSGDTDSSDDECNRNYENQKYNDCGSSIKKLLVLNSINNSNAISSSHYGVPKTRTSTLTPNPNNTKVNAHPKATNVNKNVGSGRSYEGIFLDPIFGMSIANPLISSAVLIERMQGRVAVKFSDLIRFIASDSLKDKDWVICGVIVSKSPPKTSQKGTQFSVWTISDLKDDIKTVSLFMFSGAHADLWKTVVGTVIGVLNPSIMERRDGSKDMAALSVDTAQKVMIFGQSKDFGLCKSLKKNGEKCTSIVNLSRCEFCVYHIKQEYQKCSKRSELQSNFAGQGLINLRNKVLGKNEVFYAGKSYVAIPAKKSKKLEARDDRILQNLNKLNGNTSKTKIAVKKNRGMATQLDVNPIQRARDLELLKKLGGSIELKNKTNFSGSRSNEVSLADSKATALSVISTLKAKSDSINEKESNGKYDLRGDLYINVDNKNSFSGKICNEISLDESKEIALGVISKLREKPKYDQKSFENLNSFELFEKEQLNNEKHWSENTYGTTNSKGITHTTTPQSITDLGNSKCTSTADQISLNEKCINKQIESNPEIGSRLSQRDDCNTQKCLSFPRVKQTTNMGTPKLSAFGKTDFIDLNKPVTSRQVDRAKLNALKFIQKNGPIKKVDPNNTKSCGSKKRQLDNSQPTENPSKKSKLQESDIISDRFKKMMAMTSKHSELVEQHDNEEKEKYFRKQEMKERMEEKMVNTFKVKCKAVKCLKCKYTSFSASDMCKAEQHPLKVFDAMKRFYKCSNCQNRTVTLDLIPTRPCSNCGSTKWEKTGMMKEKIVEVQHKLSIRGGEQKFVNSLAKDANLDLLVPDN